YFRDEFQAPMGISYEVGQHLDDVFGIKLSLGTQQPRALLILLANDYGALRQVIQDVAELQLEEAALFLHHQDRAQALGEVIPELRLERERHAELGDANPKLIQVLGAYPHIAQRLLQIVIRFARSGDSQPSVASAVHAVHPVAPRELAGRFKPPVIYF